MVNKKFLLGILAMVLVFGMAVIGCDSDSDNGGNSGNNQGGNNQGGNNPSGVTYSGAIGDAALSDVNVLATAFGISGAPFANVTAAVNSINNATYTLALVNAVISQYDDPDELFSGISEAQARAKLATRGAPSNTINDIINKCNSTGFVVAAMDLNNGRIGILAAKKD